MAYTPHFLVQFGGDWNAGDMSNESWSVTLRLITQDGAVGGHLNAPQAYADQVASALQAWFTATASAILGSCRLKYLKTNNIGADGHYSDPITAIHVYPGTLSGGGGFGTGFVCLAYTWETGLSIGKAKRGRMYPPNNYPPDTAGSQAVSVNAANRDAARLAGKNLLGVFGVVPPSGHTLKALPSVMSQTAGAHNVITGVSVSSVLDVQRRRKKQATENRSTILAYP